MIKKELIGVETENYIGYVYVIIHTRDDCDMYYVGKRENTNFYSDKYMGSGLLVKRAQEKYGIEKFHKKLLYCSESIEHLWKSEIAFIKYFREKYPNRLYNIADGGNGFSSREATEINKRKIRNGTHHFFKEEIVEKRINSLKDTNKRLMMEGKHIFQDTDFKEKVKCVVRDTQNKLIAEGTHHFLSDSHRRKVGKIASDVSNKLIREGNHNFQTLSDESKRMRANKMSETKTGSTALIYVCEEREIYWARMTNDEYEIYVLTRCGWVRGAPSKTLSKFYKRQEYLLEDWIRKLK